MSYSVAAAAGPAIGAGGSVGAAGVVAGGGAKLSIERSGSIDASSIDIAFGDVAGDVCKGRGGVLGELLGDLVGAGLGAGVVG